MARPMACFHKVWGLIRHGDSSNNRLESSASRVQCEDKFQTKGWDIEVQNKIHEPNY